VARDYQRGLTAVLDLAAVPGSQTAILTGEGGTGPSGLAAVAPDGRVAIVMRDLAPLSGSEVYEAWVIGSSETPVALGGFAVAAGGTATFTTSGAPIERGVVVALTREPRPGATAPAGPVVSAGKATAPES
jgi:anti-sigma-K factor RskA